MKTKISLIIALFFTLSACNNWLDIELDNKVEDSKLFSTPEGFEEALAGIYSSLSKQNMFGQTYTMEYIDVLAQYYSYSSIKSTYEYWKDYNYQNSGSKSTIAGIWNNLYSNISQANCILEWADKNASVLSESQRNQIRGEALGLRAFLHFDLLRMFGPVYKDNPTSKRITYRTEFSKEIKELQPSNVVMDSIISDLKKAETLLTGTDPLNFEFPVSDYEEEDMGGDRFLVYRHKRMNLYAVKALLARVYLYAGNKTEAENYANQVIGSGYFDLIGDASDVLRSKEIVFSVYVDDFDQQVATITNGNTYYISKEEFLDELFDVANDGSNDLRIREGVGFDYGTHGITMRKYKQENLWASTEGTVVLIRLSEMYYIL